MKTFLLLSQIFILSLLTFTTSSSQEYCEPFFTSAVGADKFTGITNVKLNSTPAIDNSSDYNDWYVYFDEVEAGGLNPGEEYELTIRVKWNINSTFFTNKVQIYAWIDWNQNFEFDKGEEIAEIDQTEMIPYSEERETKIIFTVPQDAKVGITRLRISEDMDNAGGHPKQVACGYPESHSLGQHGNVEDYNLEIISSGENPKINVLEGSLDFGEVEIGSSSSEKITIENNGNADLTISSMDIQGNQSEVFSISEDVTFPMIISAGNTNDVNINARPNEKNNFTANLIIESNSSEDSKFYIPLSVVGKLAPAEILISSDILDFGKVPTSTNKFMGGVKITNTGGQDLILDSMAFSTNQEVFVLINPDDSEALESSDFPITIGNSEDDYFEIIVEFSPTDGIEYLAKVLIGTNVGEYNVDIRGEGEIIKSLSDYKNANLNISINPNPITDQNSNIIVDLHGKSREIDMFIVDLNGNIVLKIKSENMSFGENKINLNLTNLSSGSYFLISNYMGVRSRTSIVITK
jgi:GEVED domain/Cep192 domain 4/Secretion system C-terminal sorting domain